MNKIWAEKNKTMQVLLRKRNTYEAGIAIFFDLRNELMEVLASFYEEMSRKDFDAMPFKNAAGYHSKTIAYSIWHIFRIEDIVAHTLIDESEQVFFAGKYQKRIHSPIITTGNELVKEQIAMFSKQLAWKELFSYMLEVRASTEKIIGSLSYDESKKNIPAERKEQLKALNVVSRDKNASWLIDYWCSKNIRGLIQMPFSRHWIMHIEASLRIKNKILS